MKAVARSIAMVACLGSLTACGEGTAEQTLVRSQPQPSSHGGFPQTATYLLDGEPIELVGGYFDRPVAPGSSRLERVWVQEGSAVRGDLDGDQDEDVALILVHDPGGSGTFSYLAVAVQAQGGYQGSNALFLGDRITSPMISVHDGKISARFLDRPVAAPYGDPPTHDCLVEASLIGFHLTPSSSACLEP